MQSRNRVGHCGFDGVESNVIGQWIRCRLEVGESVPEGRFGEWMIGSVSRQPVPTRLAAWMQPFAAAFTAPSWQHVLVLIVGAILAPGRRTVAAALRVVGLENDPHFTNYHRVLNRNQWSSRWIARCLLRLLIDAFAFRPVRSSSVSMIPSNGAGAPKSRRAASIVTRSAHLKATLSRPVVYDGYH